MTIRFYIGVAITFFLLIALFATILDEVFRKK
jgi:cytochrome c biogenesis protein CcdA